MIELGNIKPEDLGILIGSAGYREALKDRVSWQARRPVDSDWRGHDGPDGWGEWCGRKLHSGFTQWRRRPADGSVLPDYRPCSRQEAEANPECSEYLDPTLCAGGSWIPMHDEPNCPAKYRTRARPADEPAGMRYTFQCSVSDLRKYPTHLNEKWDNVQRVSVTVEELPAARPADEPAVDAPGTVITWQRAQERVDEGLAVETTINGPGSIWIKVTSFLISGREGIPSFPRDHRDWEYRIPLTEPAAQPEPSREIVCSDADLLKRYRSCASKIWEMFPSDPLGDSTAHFMCDRLEALVERGLLTPKQPEPVAENFNESASRIMKKLSARSLRVGWTNVFCEEIVQLEAEVERMRKLVSELQKKYDDACVQGTRELRDMTDSRDAAVTALSTEKDACSALREQVRCSAVCRDDLDQQLRDMTEERDRAVGERDDYRAKVALLRGALVELCSFEEANDILSETADETAGKGQG